MRSVLSGLKLTHVTFYQCFDRLLGLCIINEFLKMTYLLLFVHYIDVKSLASPVRASPHGSPGSRTRPPQPILPRERTAIDKVWFVFMHW